MAGIIGRIDGFIAVIGSRILSRFNVAGEQYGIRNYISGAFRFWFNLL